MATPRRNAGSTTQASVQPLHPVRKAYVFEEVLAQLEPLIGHRMLAGGRLPPERELARLLGVSRTSVREALRVLMLRGVLEPRPGRGTLIREAAPPGPSAGGPVDVFSASEQKVRDIMEVRRALEPDIAASAAVRAEAKDIARMEDILARAGEKVRVGVPAVDEDAQFHHALAIATGNVIFMRVTARSMDLIQATRRRALQTPERNQRSQEAHLRILDAIRRRDAGAARDAMLAHLDEVERLTVSRSRPR